MFTAKILGVTGWLLAIWKLPVAIATDCQADDCYRALFPCQSPQAVADAIAFCETLANRYVYATEFPARATGACGNYNKAQYLTACACGPRCSITSTGVSSSSTCSSSSSETASIAATSSTATYTLSSTPKTSVTATSSTTTATTGITSESSSTTSGASTASGITSSMIYSVIATLTVTPSQSSESSTSSQASNTTTTATLTSLQTSTATTTLSQSSSDSKGSSETTTTTVTSFTATITTTVSTQNMTSSLYATTGLNITSKSGGTTVSTKTTIDFSSDTTCVWSESISSTSATNTTLTTVTKTTGVSATETGTGSTSSGSISSSGTSAPSFSTTVTSPVVSITSITSRLNASSTSTSTSSFSPSCTPESIQNVGLMNGDFEEGLAPWYWDVAEPRTSGYGTAADGADGSCSSFKVSLVRSRGSDNDRSGFQLISPLYDVEEGQRYLFTYWVKFQYRNIARVITQANPVDTNISTAIAWREGPTWTQVRTIYIPSVNWVEFVFDYDLNGAERNTFWIDRIQLTPVPVTSSTAPGPVVATVTEATLSVSTDFTLSVLDSTPAALSITSSIANSIIAATTTGTTLTTAVVSPGVASESRASR